MLRNNFLSMLMVIPLLVKGAPDISMEVCRYRTEGTAFIEISLYTVGASLKCDDLHPTYGIEYMVIIKNQSDHIVAGNKYKLSRNGCPAQDIIDIKRFSLPAGKYVVEIEAGDLADTLSRLSIRQDVDVDTDWELPYVSDIQLLSALRPSQEPTGALDKSGLYCEPLPFRFYYPALNQLNLYVETYNTDQLEGQPYLQYSITPAQGDIPAPIITYKKVKKEPVSANVLQLDIRDLISGSYYLSVALFDGNKHRYVARNVMFYRLNPKGDSMFIESGILKLENGFVKDIPEDSLDYDLRAMAPIIQPMDAEILNSLLEEGSSKAKRFFIHRYWTAQAGKVAGPVFESYMKVARVVDENYTTGFGYGFETDRGHIFLKYGKPDDVIEVEDEPSAPPYEIWFYNTFPATHQTNVRFLFYNPSLARNAFRLLHSTAIGEIRNERWEIELYRDATLETPGVNAKNMPDNVYRNAKKYFEY